MIRANRQELEFAFRTLAMHTELDILWDSVMVRVITTLKNVRQHLPLHFNHLRQGYGAYAVGPSP